MSFRALGLFPPTCIAPQPKGIQPQTSETDDVIVFALQGLNIAQIYTTHSGGCRKGIALGAEFCENVNRRNWWSFVRGHRNWAIWEIGFERRIDLLPNSKA